MNNSSDFTCRPIYTKNIHKHLIRMFGTYNTCTPTHVHDIHKYSI